MQLSFYTAEKAVERLEKQIKWGQKQRKQKCMHLHFIF
ncbi:hypothetical protein I33_0701 [Bacillus subtilis subsp. subtilis str. RO-NN-1]|nr:hypothetical protein I33_0701 [Bacillus subtilis subsp. subtilis str. RO-NN-1]